MFRSKAIKLEGTQGINYSDLDLSKVFLDT